MDIVICIALLCVGLILLIKGGDYFVDSAVWIAKAFKVPELIIGATVVSVGTTLPELFTSLTAVVEGMKAGGDVASGLNSLAIGNAVGSMACNVGLILGICLIAKPPKVGTGFAPKAIFLAAVTALVIVFALTDGSIAVWEGVILLAAFVAFVAVTLKGGEVAQESSPPKIARREWLIRSAIFVLSAVAIAIGARLLVDGAQTLCAKFGLSHGVIGVTIVAIGTSLPELVTCVTSLVKGKSDVGVGNILGANVLNATLLLGMTAVVTGAGVPVDAGTYTISLALTAAITAVLIIPTLVTKKTFRAQGCVLLALYACFVVYNILTAS